MIAHHRYLDQGTDDWHRLRAGIPTASNFKSILAKGDGAMRRKYLRTLAYERITGEAAESYSNAYMQRGRDLENDAIAAYEQIAGQKVTSVGFVSRGPGWAPNEGVVVLDEPDPDLTIAVGCSPDGLVPGGAIEVKTMEPHILIECIQLNRFPPGHKAQIQGTIGVGRFGFVDAIGYCPGLPVYIERFRPNLEYITHLADEVSWFIRDLEALIGDIEQYRTTGRVTRRTGIRPDLSEQPPAI